MRANLGQAARSKLIFLLYHSSWQRNPKSAQFSSLREMDLTTQRIESDPSLELSRIIRKFPSVNGEKIHWLVTNSSTKPRDHEAR